MLGRFVCAALAAGFLAQGVAGPRPGTYRIEICRGDCRENSAIMAEGYLVLDSAYWSFENRTFRNDFFSMQHIGTRPNACFQLKQVRDVDTVYGGYQQSGLSRWVQHPTDHLIRLDLFSSPDAGYTAELAVTESGLSGSGHSWGFGAAESEFALGETIRATRIRDADAGACGSPLTGQDIADGSPIYRNDYIVGPPIITLFDTPIDTTWLRNWSGSVVRSNGLSGDSLTAYVYPDYGVVLTKSGIGRAAWLLSWRYATYRGLGLGDTDSWLRVLYGSPTRHIQDIVEYESTEKPGTGLRVRLHRHHVKSVCAGQLSLCP